MISNGINKMIGKIILLAIFIIPSVIIVFMMTAKTFYARPTIEFILTFAPPIIIVITYFITYIKRFERDKEVYLSDKVAIHKLRLSIYSLVITAVGMTAYVFSMEYLGLPSKMEIFWFGAAIIFLILADSFVILFRVDKGYYGYNSTEAGEIAKYVIKRSKKNKGGGGGSPTSKNLRALHVKYGKEKVIVSGEKVAKFEKSVAWIS